MKGRYKEMPKYIVKIIYHANIEKYETECDSPEQAEYDACGLAKENFTFSVEVEEIKDYDEEDYEDYDDYDDDEEDYEWDDDDDEEE